MKNNSVVDLVKYRREKSFETLKEINILLEQKLFSLAMNRVYYAGFYVVSALLLLDNFSTSKHKQLIGEFTLKRYL